MSILPSWIALIKKMAFSPLASSSDYINSEVLQYLEFLTGKEGKKLVGEGNHMI